MTSIMMQFYLTRNLKILEAGDPLDKHAIAKLKERIQTAMELRNHIIREERMTTKKAHEKGKREYEEETRLRKIQMDKIRETQCQEAKRLCGMRSMAKFHVCGANSKKDIAKIRRKRSPGCTMFTRSSIHTRKSRLHTSTTHTK
jgi:hypothetical protein